MDNQFKIVVTGTFHTEKSSLTNALEHLTGIPKTAYTRKNKFVQTKLAGKPFDKHTLDDCFRICLNNFIDQVFAEANMQGSFISEDSILQWYTYCIGNLNNFSGYISNPLNIQVLNSLSSLVNRRAYSNILSSVGSVIGRYSLDTYHSIIHLPVEFPMPTHSDKYISDDIRKICDELIIKHLQNLGIRHYIITGSLKEKLEKILSIYNFKPITSVESVLERLSG